MTTVTVVPFTAILASKAARDAVKAYAEQGGAFGYPTATVYGFGSAATPHAVRRLSSLKRRPPDKRFLLVSGSASSFESLAWNDSARRLADRFWPGRLTLLLGDPDGVFPDELRGPSGAVAVRHSAHPVVRALEWAVGTPLTSTSANAPGVPPALDAAGAADALETLGADPIWVVDGGVLRPSASSTIVDCTADRPRVLREGTFSTSAIERALSGESSEPDMETPTPFTIVFVCTGNTCRSPLAEVITNAKLAEMGWAARASSAGVHAAPGSAASAQSAAVAVARGLDLSAHQARQVDPELVHDADLLLTMGPGHLDAIASMGGSGKSAMLSAFAGGSDDPFEGPSVVDPFGAGRDVYEATYDTLEQLIDQALARLAPVLGVAQ